MSGCENKLCVYDDDDDDNDSVNEGGNVTTCIRT